MVRRFEPRFTLQRIISMLDKVDDPLCSREVVRGRCRLAPTHQDDRVENFRSSNVYRRIFEVGRKAPNILLRDYASGVVELALHRGLSLDIDIRKIRTPYLREWPSFHVPYAEQLRPLGETTEGMPDNE